MLNVNDEEVTEGSNEVGKAIRQEIAKKNIKGFISEASVFVECLGFAEKLAYLAVAGTSDPRPSVHTRGIDAIRALQEIGLEMLHVPLIGADRFLDLHWAKDERYTQTDRHKRFCAISRKYGHPQNTVNKLKVIGREFLQNQDPIPPNRSQRTANGIKIDMRQEWAVALKRDWDNGNMDYKKKLRKQINPIIGEWCDILIVSSHYAYGNDIFCTNDEGRGAGSSSLLHYSNRENLEQDGIKIVSPNDLLSCL